MFWREGAASRGVAAAALGLLLMSGGAWANGNTTADAPDPQPIKKTVRKATIKKPVKKAAPKTTAKKAPAPKPAAKPAPSSLEQGIALAEQERYGAAQPLLRKAILENRRSAAAWYWYGVCHEKTGHFYEAQYFYSKAVECDPTFEPLSRVVAWPNNGEKTPVWDPKRPARIYPVPTDGSGVAIIPPDAPQARPRPTRPPIDPELPKVPVYVPPEPGASPLDGDAWRPSVYVPPTRAEATLETTEADFPAYIPPASPKPLEPAQASPAGGNVPVYQPPQPGTQAAYQAPQGNGAPAYQPPDRPKEQAAPKTAVEKKAPTLQVPRKIVRQKKPAAPKPATAKPAAEKPVEVPPTPAKPEEIAPAQPAPEKVERPAPPRVEELPPVGQTMPEGTVEAPSMPPVGQGAGVEEGS